MALNVLRVRYASVVNFDPVGHLSVIRPIVISRKLSKIDP